MTQLSKTSRRIAAIGAALCLAALTAAAQPAAKQADDEDPGLTFQAGTKEVVLYTAVLDSSEYFVTDLPQSAFKVYEEDVLQELKYFRRQDIPVSLGILVDNSGSMRDKRRQVNTAAVDFVKASNPKDEAFIVNFNDEGFLDSPFTSDVPRLQDALQRIDARGGTALYDAVGMSLDYLKEKAKWDKRVLLIVTDGEDNASMLDLERLVRRLQEGDTVIYAVGLLSEEDRRSAKRATRAVRNIVRATGGAAFFPKSVDEVHDIAQKVAEDIRSQYILAYTPAAPAAGATFRRVRVVLSGKAGKKLQVRHRPGYYY
jgi:Ca-activated chloride channel family protein